MTSFGGRSIFVTKLDTDSYYAEEFENICHVYYELSKNNIFTSAEFIFFKPSKVFLDNKKVIGEAEEKVVELFKNKFDDYKDSGITSPGSDKYEIRFSTQQFSRKRCVVESVSISRKGFSKQLLDYLEEENAKKYSTNNSKKREYICLNCKSIVSSEQIINKCDKCNVIMIPK